MLDVLNTHISRYTAVDPAILYQGTISYNAAQELDRSGIYAITCSTCLRYVPEQCVFTSPWTIAVKLAFGGKTHGFMIDLAEYHYGNMPSLRAQFCNLDAFQAWLSTQALPLGRVQTRSTDLVLHLDCPIRHFALHQTGSVDIFVYHLLNLIDLDAVVTNEVVYIGLSHASVADRVRPHNQWGRIARLRGRETDSLIYLFDIRTERLSIPDGGISLHKQTRQPAGDLSEEDRLSLAEMHLINHLKPEYNETYKDHIPSDSVYVERARRLGYVGHRLEVELEGQLGTLSSKVRPRFDRIEAFRPWDVWGPEKTFVRADMG